MLEPTIRNHDQNFLDNCYLKLKQFSLLLMKDIVQFCNKTIDATKTEISTRQSSLKSNTTKNNLKRLKVKLKTTLQLLKRYCNNKNLKIQYFEM